MSSLIEVERKFIDKNIGRNGKIIDIGCADGDNLVYFSRKGFDVTGIDLSDEMLRKARKKIGGLDIRIVKGNICNMNMISDNRFDYVLCMFTLMNLKDEKSQKDAMAEMKRVCKPNGKIFLMVHNSNEGKNILGEWFGRRFEYRIFTEMEIKNLIDMAGLAFVKSFIVDDGKYIFAVCSKQF